MLRLAPRFRLPRLSRAFSSYFSDDVNTKLTKHTISLPIKTIGDAHRIAEFANISAGQSSSSELENLKSQIKSKEYAAVLLDASEEDLYAYLGGKSSPGWAEGLEYDLLGAVFRECVENDVEVHLVGPSRHSFNNFLIRKSMEIGTEPTLIHKNLIASAAPPPDVPLKDVLEHLQTLAPEDIVKRLSEHRGMSFVIKAQPVLDTLPAGSKALLVATPLCTPWAFDLMNRMATANKILSKKGASWLVELGQKDKRELWITPLVLKSRGLVMHAQFVFGSAFLMIAGGLFLGVRGLFWQSDDLANKTLRGEKIELTTDEERRLEALKKAPKSVF